MASLPYASTNNMFPECSDCINFLYIVNDFSVYFVAISCTIETRETDDGQTAMAPRSKAALELKRLRERAGYSVRQLAAALKAAGSPYGRSPSTFAYYESQFRRPYVPGDLVESLAPLLEGRGDPPITERQVLALGGPQFNSLWVAAGVIGEKTAPKPATDVDAELLAEILTKLSELAADSGIALSDRQRAGLAARIYRQTARLPRAERAAALDREVKEIAEIGRIFRDPPT